eukprot:scaffold174222_cov37-Prasinocladus_malaysianus.AAC.1
MIVAGVIVAAVVITEKKKAGEMFWSSGTSASYSFDADTVQLESVLYRKLEDCSNLLSAMNVNPGRLDHKFTLNSKILYFTLSLITCFGTNIIPNTTEILGASASFSLSSIDTLDDFA